MATIACPGCGLPRAESEADRACPVCEAGVHDIPSESRVIASSPTDGLPTDMSQLAGARAELAHGHRPEVVVGVIGLLMGAAIAVALQSMIANPTAPISSSPVTKAGEVADPPQVAPVESHVPVIPLAEESEFLADPTEDPAEGMLPNAAPPAKLEKRVPGKPETIVVDLDLPDGHFVFPTSVWYRAGMQIVLKGRVRHLLIGSVMGDSLVDASGLVAQKVVITRVERSVVKVNAPGGEVVVSHPVTDGSEVVIFAPKGEVAFKTNGSTKEPRIDSGSQVKVTAKKVTFSGRIAGNDTRLDLTLDNGGSLKLPAIDGGAIVEYRKADVADLPPHIDVLSIGPRAILRRVDTPPK